MNNRKIAFNNLRFYIKTNILAIIGVAISSAVITGALIVGDSLSYSLQQTVIYRLGNITHTISAQEKHLTFDFARKIQHKTQLPTAPVLSTKGVASSKGGQFIRNNIQIWGIDHNFRNVSGIQKEIILNDGEIAISKNLATELNVDTGKSVLLQIKKNSLIPENTPFVSSEDLIISKRATVKYILDKNNMGLFNLRVSQTAPYNVFVSLKWLNTIMELEDRANIILLSQPERPKTSIESAIKESWTLKDAGLKLDKLDKEKLWQIKAEDVFINEQLSHKILYSFPNSKPVLTYFVNSFTKGIKSTPYSFLSGGLKEIEKHNIWINSWLAKDLELKLGDSVNVSYYLIGPFKQLIEKERKFRVSKILPIDDQINDKNRMPDFPGLSDAGSCRDWSTGVPIDLNLIRTKDEEYWNTYKGTPKAYINITEAVQIWQNRFGKYTEILIDANDTDSVNVHQILHKSIAPKDIGFIIKNDKQNGLDAAKNGTDFSELFIGLSFFIILAGLLLSLLLIHYNISQRAWQHATLHALGFSRKQIRSLLFAEFSLIIGIGSLLGVLLSILYNNLIMDALGIIWHDIVRTSILETYIQYKTLFWGFFISSTSGIIALFFAVNRSLGPEISSVQKKTLNRTKNTNNFVLRFIGIGLLITSVTISILWFTNKPIVKDEMLLLNGFMFLVSILILVYNWLNKRSNDDIKPFTINKIIAKNLSFNKRQNIYIIALLSLACFVVLSVGANRKDLNSSAKSKTSGTGGFDYLSKTTAPILKNLNDTDFKRQNNLPDSMWAVQFLVKSGDDASCLNLNRISQPQIIACNVEALKGRFSIETQTKELDITNPWGSLNQNIGKVIPGIANQTDIKWSLGKKVGDTLLYTNEFGDTTMIKLIGGLKSSVFQGNVIISDKNFEKLYPSVSGSELALIETNTPKEDIINYFGEAFQEKGITIEQTVDVLARFKTIENTYLSIFLFLGALGLFIGSIGLTVVLARNIIQRKYEFGVLFSIGFSIRQILAIVFWEYVIIVSIAIILGFAASILASLSTLINKTDEFSLSFFVIIVGSLLLNSIIWIIAVGFSTIKRIDLKKSLAND